jgi:predicted HicB family RNase H-like nuclease
MSENDLVEIPVSKELSKRLNETAKEQGITVDQLLRKIVASATS